MIPHHTRPFSGPEPTAFRARRPRFGSLLAAGGLLLVGALAAHAAARGHAAPTRFHRAAPKPAAARLAYDLTPGSAHHYKVTAIFTGHFPPFTQPGGQPVSLRVLLGYNAAVKKADDKGAEVEFTVDSAEIDLLEKDPGPNGKIDPDSVAPWPIALQEVQQRLNVTALLRPDGSIASIEGGSAMPVQINLGIDLRKLFLLVMPVTFPDKPVKINDTWTFTDGLLGNQPGKVTYSGTLTQIDPTDRQLLFHIRQDAQAAINDKHDKGGKLTDNAADAVDQTTGKVTVTGDLLFAAPNAAVRADRCLGRLTRGHLVMNALLTRKRTAPDPDHPEDPATSNIDVQARLFVQADDARPKAQGAATAANTGRLTPSGPAGKAKD